MSWALPEQPQRELSWTTVWQAILIMSQPQILIPILASLRGPMPAVLETITTRELWSQIHLDLTMNSTSPYTSPPNQIWLFGQPLFWVLSIRLDLLLSVMPLLSVPATFRRQWNCPRCVVYPASLARSCPMNLNCLGVLVLGCSVLIIETSSLWTSSNLRII